MAPTILVTGANTGIGLALCKQLCKDYGAKVFLGSRSAERGAAAVQQVKEFCNNNNDANVELLTLDVSSDASVQEAAALLKARGDVKLTAIVNNAGTGLGHDGVTSDMVMNINVMGPKRIVEAFQDLLDPAGSRIVNVGSGSGPSYVQLQPLERQKLFVNPDITWDEIQAQYDRGVPADDPAYNQVGTDHYGLSKALLACYTMYLARTLANKNVSVYCISPGYIKTKLTAKWPGGKTPEEGTLSILYCLFDASPAEENGFYFGSDAKRSPLHYVRNPGEPVFDGTIDWDAVVQTL